MTKQSTVSSLVYWALLCQPCTALPIAWELATDRRVHWYLGCDNLVCWLVGNRGLIPNFESQQVLVLAEKQQNVLTSKVDQNGENILWKSIISDPIGMDSKARSFELYWITAGCVQHFPWVGAPLRYEVCEKARMKSGFSRINYQLSSVEIAEHYEYSLST